MLLQDMGSSSIPLIFCPKGLHHRFLVSSRTLKGCSFPYFPVSALFPQRHSFSSDLLLFFPHVIKLQPGTHRTEYQCYEFNKIQKGTV